MKYSHYYSLSCSVHCFQITFFFSLLCVCVCVCVTVFFFYIGNSPPESIRRSENIVDCRSNIDVEIKNKNVFIHRSIYNSESLPFFPSFSISLHTYTLTLSFDSHLFILNLIHPSDMKNEPNIRDE